MGGIFGNTHIYYRAYSIFKKPFPPSIIFYVVKEPENEIHIKHLPEMSVFGVDGITDGELAENALQDTGLDMIDVGRGFLVNPDFGNAVLEKRDCGKCLHCQPACRWSPFLNDGTERVLGNEVYLIDCNLGKKPCKAYVKADKQWKLIYDTAEQKGSGGAAKNLRGYEARIWKN